MQYVASVNNLSFSYDKSYVKALDNINFRFEHGKRYLLTGESGSGKTTFARAMTGLIPHFYKGRYSGEVIIDKYRLPDASIHEISSLVGYLRQNPEEQILMTTVERDIAFSLEFRLSSSSEILRRVKEVMDRFEIQHLWGRTTDTLSGGEVQKVALAGLLVTNPRIIILDEPSAYLSPKSVVNLRTILDQEFRKTTIILIDHRLDYWINYVDYVIYLSRGKIKFHGLPGKFLNWLKNNDHGLNLPIHIKLSHSISLAIGDCR